MRVTLETPHIRSFGQAPVPEAAASGKLGTRLQPPAPPPIMVPSNVRGTYGTAEYVPAVFGPEGATSGLWEIDARA